MTAPPLPPRLDAAVLVENGRHAPGAPVVDREITFSAAAAWNDVTLAIANEWWPEEYYPAWPWPGLTHPAVAFVAGCLIWNPALVDEEWIGARLLPISGLPFHPFEPWLNPSLVLERIWRQTFVQDLQAALARGETITPEGLEAADRRAAARGSEASVAATEAGEQGYYRFLPVWRGMATPDWRALEPSVRQQLAYTDDWLQEATRHLAHEGKSNRQIAGLLGIHPKTVARILRPA